MELQSIVYDLIDSCGGVNYGIKIMQKEVTRFSLI